jgi:hypothetical protein
MNRGIASLTESLTYSIPMNRTDEALAPVDPMLGGEYIPLPPRCTMAPNDRDLGRPRPNASASGSRRL